VSEQDIRLRPLRLASGWGPIAFREFLARTGMTEAQLETLGERCWSTVVERDRFSPA